MSERFNFAAILDQPTLASPALFLPVVEDTFQSRLGRPLETMQLDIKTGQQSNHPWNVVEPYLPARLSPNELFFVYYTSLKRPLARGTTIHLRYPLTSAVVTVSLEDTSIEIDPASIAQVCTQLYANCRKFAAQCIVTAGAEAEIDAESSKQALENIANPTSLGRWVVGNKVSAEGLLSTGYFSAEVSAAEFTLVRRTL